MTHYIDCVDIIDFAFHAAIGKFSNDFTRHLPFLTVCAFYIKPLKIVNEKLHHPNMIYYIFLYILLILHTVACTTFIVWRATG